MRQRLSLILLATAIGLPTSLMAEPRLYDASRADQLLDPLAEDIVPEDPELRRVWSEYVSFDALIFGRPAVQTYNQMHAQAIDPASPEFVGFNAFNHGRDLAGPGHVAFKSPNADTLYSNAYLDLSAGPVLIEVPSTAGRYYTLNFLDLFGNATNISARTHGTQGGTYLIATTDWGGDVPDGVELFRVTQQYMWILMRIEVERSEELPEVRALQDRFNITATASETNTRAFPAPADLDDPQSFLTALDWIVEEAGVPSSEAGKIHPFRGLGVGGPRSVTKALSDPETLAGARAGFAIGNRLVAGVKSQNGVMSAGWREPFDIGRYGSNYLYRAGVHDLGLGANVRLENYAFTTFIDADGERLEGASGPYELRLESVPPSDYFWSVTVYETATQELYPNSSSKYLVSSNTPDLQIDDDGAVRIMFSQDASGPNAIPVPEGSFYLALRAQGPRQEMIHGTWRPSPVRKAD